MSIKRYVSASIAVFVFIFLYEWVFHGILLKPVYNATQHLWRAQEDCVFWAMLLGQFLFPFIFAYIFTKGYEKKGIAEGIRFGVVIGLLFVPSNLIYYAVQPLPGSLVLAWCFGGIIEMAIAGAILAAVYKNS